jgi:formylglycine-generating enzyme required for sulfatase activity
MPDEWEKRFGLDPHNPNDAQQDSDGDGYTNLEEYLNSTDPKVADEAPGGADFENVLKKLDALNAKARIEIAEEVRHRPPDADADGSALSPVRKMEIQPAGHEQSPKNLAVVIDKDLKLELVPIPAGTFLMGSPEDEPERGADETQHQIKISMPFHMGATLVTSAEYKAVTGGKSRHDGGGNLPAEVDWPDSVRFCEALSKNTGRTFRLPTEAEWEYCCRAGTTTPFSTGKTISTDQANFDGKFIYPGGKPGIYRRGPTPVRSFAPNAWGLYDMHGNAFQWCSDWYGPYPEGALTDPQGPTAGADRAIRGGKYGSGPRYVRSASRYSYNPNNSSVVFGFRIVMEAEMNRGVDK